MLRRRYFEISKEVLFCHPELVSEAQKSLILLDTETSSTEHYALFRPLFRDLMLEIYVRNRKEKIPWPG